MILLYQVVQNRYKKLIFNNFNNLIFYALDDTQ